MENRKIGIDEETIAALEDERMELEQKQTQQQSRGRKINAMDAYFYQMVERVLREELAVSFGESQQEADRQLLEILR